MRRYNARRTYDVYIAENREYLGFDETLRTGPYDFATDNYAERYPYQNGLLLSYGDAAFNDNNVGEHPDEGQVLPMYSRPVPLSRSDGSPWSCRHTGAGIVRGGRLLHCPR